MSTVCRCGNNHVHEVPEATDFEAWRCPTPGCGGMDREAAKRVQREAENVTDSVSKADLLPRDEQACGECEGTMTKHMKWCRWPE